MTDNANEPPYENPNTGKDGQFLSPRKHPGEKDLPNSKSRSRHGVKIEGKYIEVTPEEMDRIYFGPHP